MPIRVRELASGKLTEVPSAVARNGLGSEFELVDDRVRVIGPDGRTATVSREKVSHALGAGFKLADDDEIAAQKLRNDAATAAGNVRGLAEEFASGVTLGGSDLALEALGVDPAGMRAREEALGGLGTVARIAGEAAPALLTGGGTAAGSVAGRAARFLPGMVLERAGARVASPIARGALEGAGYGMGQVVHESVLGETDINAEHLLAGGLAPAVLGGAIGMAIPGLSKMARRGSPSLAPAVEDVVERTYGARPSQKIARAIAGGDGARVKEWLLASGVPDAEASRISGDFVSDPARFHKAMSQGRKLDEDLAVLLRDDLGSLQKTMDDTLSAAEGAAKWRGVSIPAELADQVQKRSAKELYDISNEIGGMGGPDNFAGIGGREAMTVENSRMFGKAYDYHTLREAQEYVGRAEMRMLESSDPVNTIQVLDDLKRDLGKMIDWRAARNKAGPNVPGEVKAVHQRLAGFYDRLKRHLEDESLLGDFAVRQRVINERATADFNAQAAFRGENGNGLLGRIWNRETGEVDFRTARKIAKQYGRSGPIAGDHLDDVLEARVARLEAYAEHTSLPPAVRKQIKEARATKERMTRALKERADLAADVDAMAVVRDIEGQGSVSIGVQSTLGPVIGGMAGSVLGPLGAAVGVLAGQATRPYSTLRTAAGILSFIDGVTGRIRGATGKVRTKLEGRAVREPRSGKAAAQRIGAFGRKAVLAGASTPEDRKKTMERVRQLVASPDAFDAAMDVPTYDVREFAPNLDRLVAQKLYTAAQYLVQQQPPVTTTPFGAEMSDPVKDREFAQCYDATMDPIGVLELIPKGMFTRKHAHALQTVYPEVWNGAQAEMWESLITAQGEGRKVPLDTRSSVGIALGLPTDVGLKPAMATELAMRHSGMVPGLTPPPAPGQALGTKRPRKARAGDIKRTINTYKTPLERASTE